MRTCRPRRRCRRRHNAHSILLASWHGQRQKVAARELHRQVFRRMTGNMVFVMGGVGRGAEALAAAERCVRSPSRDLNIDRMAAHKKAENDNFVFLKANALFSIFGAISENIYVVGAPGISLSLTPATNATPV
jgi:hypothetical protein